MTRVTCDGTCAGALDGRARDCEGVGGEDDHAGRVLEQAGRQRGRAQQLGPETGAVLILFSYRERSNYF